MFLLVHHYPELNVKNNDGITALIAAVNANNAVAVNTLLKYGADAKLKDKQQKAAADYAIELNNNEISGLLGSVHSAVNEKAK